MLRNPHSRGIGKADKPSLSYTEFLRRKAAIAPKFGGQDVDEASLNPALKPHTRRMVAWAVNGGRRAWFASFGLHKTATQLEAMRVIWRRSNRPVLIVAPLGVRREFFEDARNRFTGEFAIDLRFIKTNEDIDGAAVYLTNYESVRDGKISPHHFEAVSLDEAAAREIDTPSLFDFLAEEEADDAAA